MAYKIKIEKDRIKFSSSHFTIFSANEAERLHGHNYYLTIEVQSQNCDELGFAMDMKPLKDSAFELSQKLDEYVLLPTLNPYLKISEQGKNFQCSWNHKSYSFPKEDVQLLPVTNITCENLAFWFWSQMKPKMPKTVNWLSVSVKETHGQESIYENVI
jgi:6-pyruvoyltetrahydropterin/6-carboxytetrahydropterin synthase